MTKHERLAFILQTFQRCVCTRGIFILTFSFFLLLQIREMALGFSPKSGSMRRSHNSVFSSYFPASDCCSTPHKKQRKLVKILFILYTTCRVSKKFHPRVPLPPSANPVLYALRQISVQQLWYLPDRGAALLTDHCVITFREHTYYSLFCVRLFLVTAPN